MSTDKKTLKVYAKRAVEYAHVTANSDRDPLLEAFIGGLQSGAHVLDLGCGPGIAAARMTQAGLKVDAVDAVPEMVEMANQRNGVTAREALFEDIKGIDLYDGVWANFSLLHAPREEFPEYLDNIRSALRAGGLFHIGMKTGKGTHRDALKRRYTYYKANELYRLLRAAGFTPFATTSGEDKGLDGTIAKWVAITSHG